jgi:hypothetical protein
LIDYYSWVMAKPKEDPNLNVIITRFQGEIIYGTKPCPLPPSMECLQKAFNEEWIPDYRKLNAIRDSYSLAGAPIFQKAWIHVKEDLVNTPRDEKYLFLQKILQVAFSAAWSGRESDMPPYEDFPATECDYLDIPDYVRCYSKYLNLGITDIAPVAEIKQSSQEMTILNAEMEGITKEKDKIAVELELSKRDHQISIQAASIATLEKAQLEQQVARRDETIQTLQKETASLKIKLKLMTNKRKKAEEENEALKAELAYNQTIPTRIIGQEGEQNTRNNTNNENYNTSNEDFSDLLTDVDTMTKT